MVNKHFWSHTLYLGIFLGDANTSVMNWELKWLKYHLHALIWGLVRKWVRLTGTNRSVWWFSLHILLYQSNSSLLFCKQSFFPVGNHLNFESSWSHQERIEMWLRLGQSAYSPGHGDWFRHTDNLDSLLGFFSAHAI